MTQPSSIIFANDTSGENNPGCQAVCKMLDTLLTGPHLNACVTRRLPLGYGANPFKPIAATSQQCVVETPTAFPIGILETPVVDLEKWEQQRQTSIQEDPELIQQLGPHTTLVVNGEGSIHHNFPRALALLALIKTASETGSRVLLLNSTLQALDDTLMRQVLPLISHIHVRGPLSQQLVQSYQIPCACSPDIAFAAVENQSHCAPHQRRGNQVLVTAGVLARDQSLTTIFNHLRTRHLEPVYYSIGDAGEDHTARKVCADQQIPFIDAKDIPFDQLTEFLSSFEMAICGRHHINIFLMKAGVPFVPLPSNTWKIEETLNLCQYPVPIVYNHTELQHSIDHVWKNRRDLAQITLQCYDRSLAELKDYFHTFPTLAPA